ncbi:hypothetical protein AQUCO_03800192v1 [Aquilegia coerulea]|uniref:BTB domain-containing protein n=1 Tax=Aquilegia coerulea TaxID=218851 RepID=A0A2G5CSZ5_AQUCA|nr:hypothetical protein AQUCO_03800192v1 [Aquilegia coerulea]
MDYQTTLVSDSNSIGSNNICKYEKTHSPEITIIPNIVALNHLSLNLESILFDTQNSNFSCYSDAKIIVSDTIDIPVHRCILSARSSYFKKLFSSSEEEEKIEEYTMKEIMKDFEVGFESMVLVIRYLYSGKIKDLPMNVCICVDDDCQHLGCKPAIDSLVELLYAYFVFQIPDMVALYQCRLLDILDKVLWDDNILVILSVAIICSTACERLLSECIEIVVKSDINIVTLEKALPPDILKQIMDSRSDLAIGDPECNTFPNKHVKRIHMALDSDDVELVRWLLKEGHTTLDDAYALHYAVAYCDVKTTAEILDLGLADVNHRNARGYTVLHVAAMRKEPNIIVSLLTKGSRPSDLTPDGKKAIQISKRLARFRDYNRSTEEGKSSPKDCLCIDILEQAERRDPLLGEASSSLTMAGDDLRMKLLYLENRGAMCIIHQHGRLIYCVR